MAESIPTITLPDVSRIGPPPITRIKSDEDVELWKSKRSYQDYRIFLRRLNESVVGCTLPWEPEKRSQVESTYFSFSSRCSSRSGSWKNVSLTQHSWCVDRRDSTSQHPTTVWELGFSDMGSATGRGWLLTHFDFCYLNGHSCSQPTAFSGTFLVLPISVLFPL